MLALFLLFLSAPVSASAPVFSDVSGHWAEAAVLRWSEIGILNGYPDGTFRPDDTVKRGELATIINKLMHFPEAPDGVEIFTDLDGKWYASDVKALAFQGAYLVTHGEAKGDDALTREEAMAMVYNAFPVSFPRYPNTFSDSDGINPDYSEKINIMLNAGFLSGFPDGSFHPRDPITRAQVMTILNNMIDEYITEPGVYEGLEGKRVLIAVPNVEIRNTANLSYLAVSPKAGIGGGVETSGARFATVWSYDLESASVKMTSSSNSVVRRFLQKYDDRFAGGTGLDDFPYLISNQTQLMLLNEYLRTQYRDMHFALANDVTLSGQWAPIGFYNTDMFTPSSSFYSSFDGRGFAINGLSILSDIQNGDAVGLFASIGGLASIRNLTISGEISFRTTGILRYVGGICGYAGSGAIDNCTSHVNIAVNTTSAVSAGGIVGFMERGTLSNCRADGNISVAVRNPTAENFAYAGGITGTAKTTGTISNCTSHANVSAHAYDNALAGGVVGYLTGDIILFDCQAHGEIMATSTNLRGGGAYAGGVAGCIDFYGTVRGCISHASVTSTASFKSHAGGIAGFILGSPGSSQGILDSCQAYGEINAITLNKAIDSGSHAGGIAGLASRAKVTSCYSEATVTASGGYYSFAGGITGLLTNTVVGSFRSIMEDCFSLGTVHAQDSLMQNNSGGAVGQMFDSRAVRCATGAQVSASGNPGYFNAVGGFAGSMYEDTSAADCYSVGPVSCPEGFSSIAGFVGRMAGSLENCYTASPISAGKPLNDFSLQGLVGTIRTDIQTANCGVFTGVVLHFFDNVDIPSGVITPVQRQEIRTAQIYQDQGWNFETIWVMPNGSDSYKLPILRGVFEDGQRALSMPAHL